MWWKLWNTGEWTRWPVYSNNGATINDTDGVTGQGNFVVLFDLTGGTIIELFGLVYATYNALAAACYGGFIARGGYTGGLEGSGNNKCVIYRDSTQLGAASITNASADRYVVFRLNGTSLYCKAWKTDEQEPSNWLVSVTDSTYSSGYIGARVGRGVTISDNQVRSVRIQGMAFGIENAPRGPFTETVQGTVTLGGTGKSGASVFVFAGPVLFYSASCETFFRYLPRPWYAFATSGSGGAWSAQLQNLQCQAYLVTAHLIENGIYYGGETKLALRSS